MTFKVYSILHASFLIENLDRSLIFYRDVLGLEFDRTRPEMSYPGAWLRLSEDQQLHLLQLPIPDSQDRPEHGGHDRHVALKVDSVERLKKVLNKNRIQYTQSQSRSHVIFCRDPDGNALEFISEPLT